MEYSASGCSSVVSTKNTINRTEQFLNSPKNGKIL